MLRDGYYKTEDGQTVHMRVGEHGYVLTYPNGDTTCVRRDMREFL